MAVSLEDADPLDIAFPGSPTARDVRVAARPAGAGPLR